MTSEGPSALPYPQRTISDEFGELQYIVSQFQTQLDAPHGTVGLHPFGPVNVDAAKTAFTQACQRLRSALSSYRDTTLASWTQLLAEGGQAAEGVALTHKAAAAERELDEMRRIADALHSDAAKCRGMLLDAAASAIFRAGGPSGLVEERLRALARRLGLAHYTEKSDTVTTVTLAGAIIVIDVDMGPALKVKVSYVSGTDDDARIDALMGARLRAGDIGGFEQLVEQLAALDRLTRERAPASFIHNTFAQVATLADIHAQELGALNGDPRLLLRSGSGVALPHARHVGASSLYFMPPELRLGLADADWEGLAAQKMTESVGAVAGLCHWLHYAWEASAAAHCFLPPAVHSLCVGDDASASAVTVRHPGIAGLHLLFLELSRDTQPDEGLWIPYTLVARVDPPLPACALTVRAIMAATNNDAAAAAATAPAEPEQAAHDSPRLLENAPTLESLVRSQGSQADPSQEPSGAAVLRVAMDAPQIRAWTVCRIPVPRAGCVLAVTAILRRQATFNSLLRSCFTEAAVPVAAKTHANDPFRVDVIVNQNQNQNQDHQAVVLRVADAGDVLAWTHQALGVAPDDLAGVAPAALTRASAHAALGRVADISHSVPAVAQWLASHAL